MSTFRFNPKVDLDRADTTDAALGSAASEAWADEDLGKAVKLNAAATNSYALAADGDEIEGFLLATEPFTVNQGWKFGTVQRDGRVIAENGDIGALAVGDLVVTATQAAVGTAGKAVVKGGAPTTFKWRVISLLAGAGGVGEDVLIERI